MSTVSAENTVARLALQAANTPEAQPRAPRVRDLKTDSREIAVLGCITTGASVAAIVLIAFGILGGPIGLAIGAAVAGLALIGYATYLRNKSFTEITEEVKPQDPITPEVKPQPLLLMAGEEEQRQIDQKAAPSTVTTEDVTDQETSTPQKSADAEQLFGADPIVVRHVRFADPIVMPEVSPIFVPAKKASPTLPDTFSTDRSPEIKPIFNPLKKQEVSIGSKVLSFVSNNKVALGLGLAALATGAVAMYAMTPATVAGGVVPYFNPTCTAAGAMSGCQTSVPASVIAGSATPLVAHAGNALMLAPSKALASIPSKAMTAVASMAAPLVAHGGNSLMLAPSRALEPITSLVASNSEVSTNLAIGAPTQLSIGAPANLAIEAPTPILGIEAPLLSNSPFLQKLYQL